MSHSRSHRDSTSVHPSIRSHPPEDEGDRWSDRSSTLHTKGTHVWEPLVDDVSCLRIYWLFVREAPKGHLVEILIRRPLAPDLVDLPHDFPLALKYPKAAPHGRHLSTRLIKMMASNRLFDLTGSRPPLKLVQTMIAIEYGSARKFDFAVINVCIIDGKLPLKIKKDSCNFQWITWANLHDLESYAITFTPWSITTPCSLCIQFRRNLPIRGGASCCVVIEAKDTKKILVLRHSAAQSYYVPCVDPFHLLDLEKGPMEARARLADIAFKRFTGLGLFSKDLPPAFEEFGVMFGPDGPDGADEGVRTVIVLKLFFEKEKDVPSPKPLENENGLIRYTWQPLGNLRHIRESLSQDLRIICDNLML
ncbi:hypothetical protein T439DRAFT_359624 [Meredithblackwellia eburnea MCA 4105]